MFWARFLMILPVHMMLYIGVYTAGGLCHG